VRLVGFGAQLLLAKGFVLAEVALEPANLAVSLEGEQAAEGRDQKLQIFIPSGDRLGDHEIEVDGLRKGFGDKLLIEDLSFSLPKAGIVGIVGIIGPNGAGKNSTACAFGPDRPVANRSTSPSSRRR